jgi:peptidoglycan/LPS O-acetylase OafA/YrhL
MIGSLTSLRWFCALYVYFFHIAIRIQPYPKELVPVFDNGYVGMSFFFILSGFVLSLKYVDQNFDASTFMVDRLSRIYPAFFLAFIVTSPSFSVVMHSPLYFLNSVFNILLIQAWTPNLFPIGINSGMWSLSVEMFFYMLFPFVLPFIMRALSAGRRWYAAIAILWLASFLPGLIELVSPSDRAGLLFYYSSPIYRLPEFIMGAMLGSAWRRGLLPKISPFMVIGFGSIYLFSCYQYDGMARQNQTLLNCTIVPFVSSLLIYAAQSRPRFLEFRPLVYLGEISYGFYIYQFLFFGYIYGPLRAVVGDVAVMLLGVVITAVFASVSHHLLERPARHAIRWAWRHWRMTKQPIEAAQKASV